MKAVVEDGCIACGMCVSICPEVFCMGDEIAQVHADVTEENEKGPAGSTGRASAISAMRAARC